MALLPSLRSLFHCRARFFIQALDSPYCKGRLLWRDISLQQPRVAPSRPNRSIDDRRTFTSLETQSCRLLQLPETPNTADLAGAEEVDDVEAGTRPTPNNQVIASIILLLTPGIGPGFIAIEPSSRTDIFHKVTDGCI
jgi:hypothetical protein